MKNYIIALLFLSTLASCSKSNIEPNKPTEEGVTYKVECNQCLVEFEDSKYNRTNELERSRSQTIVVTGSWEYNFSKSDLEVASMDITISVFQGKQDIKGSIIVDGEVMAEFNGSLGPNDNPFDDYRTNEILEVVLK